MNWFNYIGLIIIVVIMIPNIIYGTKHKEGFNNSYKNKMIEALEQMGRYGCMAFMMFNIPCTYFGFWFDSALIVYITVNAVLCVAYITCWAIFWNKTNLARALTLSILPSCIFLFDSIMLLNIPLMAFALIFATCHILISCKNV